MQFTFTSCTKVPCSTENVVEKLIDTDMANKGMELPELARLLGHSDVSMSYRYYNLTKGTLDKARNILNRRAVVNG
jgi:integrase